MRSAFARSATARQLPRDHGRAEVGAGYGDRTRLTGLGSQDITTMLSPHLMSGAILSRAPRVNAQ